MRKSLLVAGLTFSLQACAPAEDHRFQNPVISPETSAPVVDSVRKEMQDSLKNRPSFKASVDSLKERVREISKNLKTRKNKKKPS